MGTGKDFLDATPKALIIKEKIWYFGLTQN